MSQMIPETHADLLQKPAFGNLGTLMKDGSPQVTPIWVDYDGKFVRFNSAKGRVKDKNVRRDPRVSISLQDPANPYRYLEVRGRVVEITEKGADDHINKLSQKYLGKPIYPFRQPGEVPSPTKSNRKKPVRWAETKPKQSSLILRVDSGEYDVPGIPRREWRA